MLRAEPGHPPANALDGDVDSKDDLIDGDEHQGHHQADPSDDPSRLELWFGEVLPALRELGSSLLALRKSPPRRRQVSDLLQLGASPVDLDVFQAADDSL